MAEAFVNVTEGSGKKVHGWDRTIGANTVQDEYVQLGETALPEYIITSAAVTVATANDHMLQVMAGGTNVVRIRRITLSQSAAPAAVTAVPIQLLRLTTAGTTGTAVTPRPFDTAAAAAGATCISRPTVKGTEGVLLFDRALWAGTAAIPVREQAVIWDQQAMGQPIIIPAGTTNGIVLKNTTGIATLTYSVVIEFTETAFV